MAHSKTGGVLRSENRPYLGSVDHIRAFAALLVVCYHGTQLFMMAMSGDRPFDRDRDWPYSTNPLATIVYEGHTGVSLFMALSGFIFTIGTLDRRISFGRFMSNRLLRIYPLFLLIVVLAIAMKPWEFTVQGFALQVLGFGNWPAALQFGAVGVVFWAIAVEMQFYVLFPALNALLSRFGLRQFLRLFGAVVAVRMLVWAANAQHLMLYDSLAGRIDQFLLGMVAAWLFVRHRDRFLGWWKVAGAAALAVGMLWAFNQLQGQRSQAAWRILWPDVEGAVWALVILTYVVTCRSTGWWSRALSKVGELSYSVYLLHYAILAVLVSHRVWIALPGVSPLHNGLITSVAAIPLVLAVSWLTYHGVEKLFLQFRVKYRLPDGGSVPLADRSTGLRAGPAEG
ncbi:acyltransferase family protein [Solihabitans fulvus]|uniref:acyltransferase family protein n=1 Tax=Solihabitans fulvus TaxID=1892852 RepID=UPI001CB76100|nr:acyltransferase [Solihabitans fulvus]